MSKPLKKGFLYRFRYDGPYAHDPNPFVLVLWSGKEYTHGLTLNPLGPRLTGHLIEMIAMIATKKLAANNAHNLYHSYIKKQLPSIVKMSYRTYKTSRIKNPQPISKGYLHVKSFLSALKANFTKEDTQEVIKSIKKAVKTAKNTKAQFRRQHIFSLFRKDEDITSEELNKRTRKYMDMIQGIREETVKKYRRKRKRSKKRTYL